MRAIWIVVATVSLAGCATLSGDAPANRYLAKGVFSATAALPPAPRKGSPVDLRDREVFHATRALKDTPRWSLAQADNVEQNVMDAYACALGFTPTRQTNPKLAALLLRMSRDVRSAVSGPKLKYHRPRPFRSESGPLCIKPSFGFSLSPDYPSGHATWGWSVALALAELAPDRREAILARAKAYGESRVVCGVHNASSVEAGRINAENLFTALRTSDAFKSDLAAARAEMDAARRSGLAPEPARCEADAAVLAKPLL